jgi:hypothetical protein
MKSMKHYVNNITIVFGAMAVLFVFMLFSAAYVTSNVMEGSSADILKKELRQHE